MKLYPPYIDGKLPAFFKEEEKDTVEIKIPFQMNPLVGTDDFNKIVISIRTMSGAAVGSVQNTENIIFEEKKAVATFSGLSASLFNIGQFYKVQIAYAKEIEDTDPITINIGYYSTVGIIKYTAPATVTIENLDKDRTCACPSSFTGVYIPANTDNEKIYSYRFDIYDEYMNLYNTSGDQIHNAENTTNKNTWTPNIAFQPDRFYTVQYSIVTQNLLELQSPQYSLIEGLYEEDTGYYSNFILQANFDPENGKIIIQGTCRNNMKGYYKIVRASSEDNYTEWIDLFDFAVANRPISKGQLVWNDYNLKHGIKYKYAVQRYNSKGARVKRAKETKPISADFEDMFLYDGTRQLRIAFNPKISSFKSTIQETKTDTIGGAYPFFYRNGNISYKEFPISGLISINMDKNFEFFAEKKVNQLLNLDDGSDIPKRPYTPSPNVQAFQNRTSLTTETMLLEREFKLEVMNWLNNGEPKLFRSPAEGNYLIRLMNISLSPNDTLGRMIHTFSATAYEVGKSDWRNLKKEKNFIPEEIKLNTTKHGPISITADSTRFTITDGKLQEVEVINGGTVALNTNSGEELPVISSFKYYSWKNLSSTEEDTVTQATITISSNNKYHAYYNYLTEQIINDDFILEPKKLDFGNSNMEGHKAYFITAVSIEKEFTGVLTIIDEKNKIFYNLAGKGEEYTIPLNIKKEDLIYFGLDGGNSSYVRFYYYY